MVHFHELLRIAIASYFFLPYSPVATFALTTISPKHFLLKMIGIDPVGNTSRTLGFS